MDTVRNIYRTIRAACLIGALLATIPARALSVCFTPGTECTAVIVRELDAAKTSIRVQAYGFTHPAIARALYEAKKRGVDVQVILDRSNKTAKYSSMTFLKNNAVPVSIDGKHPIAHNKIVIVDGETVVSGSFNLTRAAEHNAENVLVIHDAELAAKYLDNWRSHREHSE